jgi:hypothetical protein
MHTDQSKRFDRRNIQSNLRRGVINPKEYESHLAKLPDVSEKIYDSGEELPGGEPESASGSGSNRSTKKKGGKGKGKGRE